MKEDAKAFDDYARNLAEQKGLVFKRVLKRKVYKYQQIELNGDRLYITGVKKARNAFQFAYGQNEVKLLVRVLESKECADSELLSLFSLLVRRFEKRSSRLARQLKLSQSLDAFASLGSEEKKAVLASLVQISAAKTNKANLSSIGGSKSTGDVAITFSKELSDPDVDFWFIDSSVTGMFERRYKIGF